MNELEARALLFSAIEGGHSFWSREIYGSSALHVYEKLINGGYDTIKYAQLLTDISSTSADQILTSIQNHGAQFIVPGDVHWPLKVEDHPPVT